MATGITLKRLTKNLSKNCGFMWFLWLAAVEGEELIWRPYILHDLLATKPSSRMADRMAALRPRSKQTRQQNRG
jgi:hypothetical protein